MLPINVCGLSLGVNIHYVHVDLATRYANGHSELEWTLESGADEIGETISRKGLDLIDAQFQSDIERAIWAQIGR
jgi:hypothetical protein